MMSGYNIAEVVGSNHPITLSIFINLGSDGTILSTFSVVVGQIQ